VLIENSSYYTNTVPASSYRGFGCAQVTLPGESQIDELAAKIGKDPYEFRLANAAKPGEEFFPGMRPFDGTLKEDLDTAAEGDRLERLPCPRAMAAASPVLAAMPALIRSPRRPCASTPTAR
jgi:CO/xanthine dehydrogenase Mo-binding subunit